MIPRDDYYGDLNVELLTTLRNLQNTHNVLLRNLRRVYDDVTTEDQDSNYENIRDVVLTITTPGQHLDRRTHNIPSTVEVAAFIPDYNYDNDHVNIRLFPRRGGTRYINHLHRDYDSICYPLFFIHGNPGFEERIPLNHRIPPQMQRNANTNEEAETDSDNENDNPRQRSRNSTHNNINRFNDINNLAHPIVSRNNRTTSRNRIRRLPIRDLRQISSLSPEENENIILQEVDLHQPEEYDLQPRQSNENDLPNGDLLRSEGYDVRRHQSRGRQQYQSASQHYSYRLMVRNTENNILLKGKKLLQQFLCDIYIKIESIRMLFYRNNQDKLR